MAIRPAGLAASGGTGGGTAAQPDKKSSPSAASRSTLAEISCSSREQGVSWHRSDETYTCLDLIARLDYPVILVTGSYLGSDQPYPHRLVALRGKTVPIRGIVVSESTPSAGLTDTVESLEQFAGRADVRSTPSRGSPAATTTNGARASLSELL